MSVFDYFSFSSHDSRYYSLMTSFISRCDGHLSCHLIEQEDTNMIETNLPFSRLKKIKIDRFVNFITPLVLNGFSVNICRQVVL